MAKKSRSISKKIQKIPVSPVEQDTTHIQLPKKVVKYSVIGFCLLLFITLGIFIQYRQATHMSEADKAELEFLRKNNQEQITKIERLASDTSRLQSDMERLNALDAELRRIVNNDNPQATSRSGTSRPSVGSISNADPQIQQEINAIYTVVNDLQSAVKIREESLIELKEELLAKKAKSASRPSIWPATGEVTSRFGWRGAPTGRGSDYHPGIDIANSIGTPIVATANGKVIHSDWYSGYGKLVQIDHGNGIVTLYGHNSQILVHDGQMVKKGELIAYLGNTGYSTGPHVHYEVRVDGTAVNPASFLN